MKMESDFELKSETASFFDLEDLAKTVVVEEIKNSDLGIANAEVLPDKIVGIRIPKKEENIHDDMFLRSYLKNASSEKSANVANKPDITPCGSSQKNRVQVTNKVINSKRYEETKSGFKCHNCNYTVKKYETLKAHLNRCKMTYKCSDCNYTALREINLINHCKRIHSNEKPYTCNICEYCTADQPSMFRHKKSHLNLKNYKCCLCDFRSNHKYLLSRHMKTHEPGTFKCHFCDYSACRQDSLQIHILKHEESHLSLKNYKCCLCDFRSNHKYLLSRHIKTHRPRTFKCHFCDYSACRQDRLQTHVLNQHVMKPFFKCNDCSFSTTRKQSLIRHIRHTHDLTVTQQNFMCDLCGFKTKTKGTLVIHMRQHTGEKPYKCAICESSFSYKLAFRRHLKTHESDIEKKTSDSEKSDSD